MKQTFTYLADQLEDGEPIVLTDIRDTFGFSTQQVIAWDWAKNQPNQSLDSARKLHDEAAPGEDFCLGVSDGECSASIVMEYCEFIATGDTLAEAWVVAICRYKAAQQTHSSDCEVEK